MADDKKKKEKKKGSGAGTIFLIGLILGILGGICLGWLIPAPEAFKKATQDAKIEAKDAVKGATDKVRGGTANALEKGADTVRPEEK